MRIINILVVLATAGGLVSATGVGYSWEFFAITFGMGWIGGVWK